MLLTMKAYTEAMRGLVYDAVAAEDRSHHAPTEEERQTASERLALLTPIAKSWCTDRGVEMASVGVQVHGGMGFVEETGAAQFYRDARITPIYEGTNGIQAIDLVMRKLPMSGGAVIEAYLGEIDHVAKLLGEAGEEMADIRTELDSAIAAVRSATHWLNTAEDANDRMAGATPYQDMLGTLAGGYYLARQALAALPLADDDPWMAAKVATARFYATNLLPKVHGLADSVTAGADVIYAIDDSLIGAPA